MLNNCIFRANLNLTKEGVVYRNGQRKDGSEYSLANVRASVYTGKDREGNNIYANFYLSVFQPNDIDKIEALQIIHENDEYPKTDVILTLRYKPYYKDEAATNAESNGRQSGKGRANRGGRANRNAGADKEQRQLLPGWELVSVEFLEYVDAKDVLENQEKYRNEVEEVEHEKSTGKATGKGKTKAGSRLNRTEVEEEVEEEETTKPAPKRPTSTKKAKTKVEEVEEDEEFLEYDEE